VKQGCYDGTGGHFKGDLIYGGEKERETLRDVDRLDEGGEWEVSIRRESGRAFKKVMVGPLSGRMILKGETTDL